MSSTEDLQVALQYSASKNALLLRLRTQSFMERGADLSYAYLKGVNLKDADLRGADLTGCVFGPDQEHYILRYAE